MRQRTPGGLPGTGTAAAGPGLKPTEVETALLAAALQFSLAHPVAAAVIPGATRPSRIAEDIAALDEDVPAAFWRDLRASGLVSPAAPLPDGA
ncbi:hypothetical protein ACZ91_42275 [Streptomyces regensis]|nr:hypothetical protein ACZ91_42275 [Streptomyces regensis]